MDKPAARIAVIEHALPHVVFDGWTLDTLKKAAVEAGYGAGDTVRIFPRGVTDALDAFAEWADQAMLGAYAGLPAPPEKIRVRIATLVRLRLEALAPYREAERRAVALASFPSYAPLAMRSLARTVDTMWKAAGDTATDFNWYTKRLLLSGVYTSTLLVWLNDKSLHFQESWAFLDRRIENVMAIQKLTGRRKKAA